MRTWCSTILVLLLPFFSFAQSEGNVWFMGDSVFIDFGQGFPSVSANAPFGTREAASSVCDSAGNLLFYTNGWMLNDQSHSTVQGWDPFSVPTASTETYAQGTLLLPLNDSTYLFFTRLFGGIGRRGYFKIDLTSNGGLGAIDTLPTILGDSLTECFAAVRHADGKSWWLVSHTIQSNVFVKWHIDEEANATKFTQSIGGTHPPSWEIYDSPLVFNPKGDLFALAADYGRVEIFKFNRCTGEISTHKSIQKAAVEDNSFYGLSFSPSGKFLYLSDRRYGMPGDTFGFPSKLMQYCMDSANLLASEKLIWTSPPPCEPWWTGIACRRAIGGHKLAPDGKIYIGNASDDGNWGIFDSLSVIHSPDSPGVACDFRPLSFPLSPGSGWAPPNIPNYRLGPLLTQVAEGGPEIMLCPGDSVQLGVPDTTGSLQFIWWPATSLDDPTKAQPKASPDSTTVYYLMVEDTTVSAACNSTIDSVLVTVIDPQVGVPSANAGRDSTICPGESVLLGAPDPSGGAWAYSWTPSSALSDTTLPQPTATPGGTEQFILSVSRPEITGTCMTVHDTVEVAVFDPSSLPVSAAGSDEVICQGDTIQLGEMAQPNLQYAWSPTTALDDSQSAVPFTWPYQTTAFELLVKDSSVTGDCGEIWDTVIVRVEEPFSHESPLDVEFCPGECFEVGVEAQSGYSYLWSPTTALDDPLNSLTMARPSASTVYSLSVVSDTMQSSNCREQIFQIFATADNCAFQTVLAPGSGVAEVLDFGSFAAPIDLQVFDVRGRLVFRKYGYGNDWAGEGLEEGIYFYKLEVAGKCGVEHIGKLVVVR